MARNPFEEIERMFDRMSSQFEPFEGGALQGGSVAVDVEDAGDEFVVTADLPGYDRDDIDVQLAGERLTLSAERAESSEDAGDGRYVRRERRQRSVSRSVRLPEPVDEGGTEATYRNGVLTVTLPKTRADDGHDIPIR
jgi:HSP20 family protein